MTPIMQATRNTKARFNRRTSHEPNRMLIRENKGFFSFAFDSAHVKCGVWTWPKWICIAMAFLLQFLAFLQFYPNPLPHPQKEIVQHKFFFQSCMHPVTVFASFVPTCPTQNDYSNPAFASAVVLRLTFVTFATCALGQFKSFLMINCF